MTTPYRSPYLTETSRHPDIEAMTHSELESEVAICLEKEAHCLEMGQSIGRINTSFEYTQAHAWFRRRQRVQELLAIGMQGVA